MQMSDLPGKELNMVVMGMFTKVRQMMREQNENFNKYMENKRKSPKS